MNMEIGIKTKILETYLLNRAERLGDYYVFHTIMPGFEACRDRFVRKTTV